MRIAGLRLGVMGLDSSLCHVVQLVVQGHRHRIALAHLVIAHGRTAVLVEKAVAAEHARNQARRMVPPVEQVGAGNVSPVVPARVLEDVEQVVASLPEDRPVGIERHTASFRSHEVVAGAKGIAQQASRNARLALSESLRSSDGVGRFLDATR
jgi:hypothetical protein